MLIIDNEKNVVARIFCGEGLTLDEALNLSNLAIGKDAETQEKIYIDEDGRSYFYDDLKYVGEVRTYEVSARLGGVDARDEAFDDNDIVGTIKVTSEETDDDFNEAVIWCAGEVAYNENTPTLYMESNGTSPDSYSWGAGGRDYVYAVCIKVEA